MSDDGLEFKSSVKRLKEFQNILKLEDSKNSTILDSLFRDIDPKLQSFEVFVDTKVVKKSYNDLVKGVFRGYDDLVDVVYVKALVDWIEKFAFNVDVYKKSFEKNYVDLFSALETKNNFIKLIIEECSDYEKEILRLRKLVTELEEKVVVEKPKTEGGVVIEEEKQKEEEKVVVEKVLSVVPPLFDEGLIHDKEVREMEALERAKNFDDENELQM